MTWFESFMSRAYSPRFCAVLLLSGLLLCTLSGCGVVTAIGDFLFGVTEVDPDGPEGPLPPVPTQSPGGGIATTIATMLGFGNIAQGVAGLYLNVRRKQWLDVGKATALGLNRAYEKRKLVKDADGVERWYILADALFSEVERAQVSEGVKRDAQAMVKAVEAEHGDPDKKPAPVTPPTG